MKRMLLLICVFLLTSCGNGGVSTDMAPELLEPQGVNYDTAVVTRGDLGQIKQYRAGVKAYTKGVFFDETNLSFLRYHVSVGQTVKQGDILAELDTEMLLKDITKQEKAIEHLQKITEHELEMKNLDIEISMLELDNMILSGASESDIERKKTSVHKQTLELNHIQESGRLDVEQSSERLDESKALLDSTIITAPFDGTVVYMEKMYEGNHITPFKPLVYIADESKIIVEYTGNEYFSYSQGQILTAQMNGKLYNLEYNPLPLDETLAYVLDGRTPPAKFTITDPDEDIRLGGFVSVYAVSNLKSDVLILPVNTIYSGNGESYVYLMIDGEKVIRYVKTGIKTESSIEIKEGVNEGDEVFVKQ